MKHITTIFFCLLALKSLTQELAGNWRGAIIQKGYSIEKATVFYLELEISGDQLSGISRDEIYNNSGYALKKLSGKQNGLSLTFSQSVVTKKSNSSTTRWCRNQFDLTYNKETGYLEGTYKSTDCENNIGTVILYRSDLSFSKEVASLESHHWFDELKKDLAKGFNAPEVRKLERENFKFMPIYFDYDKSEIRPEYFSFLDRMIRVVDGHSDLRVLVTGHTDSDGSDGYNDDLSKRRAQAIIEYFTSKGLSKDRLEFDFKGEKQPADTNSTPEGKQHNRRVDFIFI